METFTDGFKVTPTEAVGLELLGIPRIDANVKELEEGSIFALLGVPRVSENLYETYEGSIFALLGIPVLEHTVLETFESRPTLVEGPVMISKTGEKILFISSGVFSFRETPVYEEPAIGFTQMWTR